MNQETVVGSLAFLLIGGWFATAKTIPAIHAITITVLDGIVGWQGGLGLDPTDLMTLPVLLIAWRIWRQVAIAHPARPYIWWVLALGTMGTLATSCIPPTYGITQLCQSEDRLYAMAFSLDGPQFFRSRDAGITWQLIRDIPPCFEFDQDSDGLRGKQQSWLLATQAVTYRFAPGDGIYSYSGNREEKREIDLSAIGTSAHRHYYEAETFLCQANVFIPGPLDALVDKQTGNVVVAMGLDGILLHQASGSWNWIKVDQYHLPDFQNVILKLAEPQFATLMLLAALFSCSLLLVVDKMNGLVVGVVIGGWFVWLVTGLFPSGLVLAFRNLFNYIALFIVLPSVFWFFSQIAYLNSIRVLFTVIIFTILAVGLYLLPYLLWIQNTIPNQGTAKIFSIMLLIATYIGAAQWIRRWFPDLKPKRKKQGDEVIPFAGEDSNPE